MEAIAAASERPSPLPLPRHMDSMDLILDSAKVIAHFGEWPSFHDMEVVSVHMDRRGTEGPSIEFVVFARGGSRPRVITSRTCMP